MRSKTSEWFVCKVKYDRSTEDSALKKVSEVYIIEALSFSEAETKITEEITPFVRGEFEIADLKKAKYKEIFFTDDEISDKWYKAKLQFLILDENSGKEKRTNTLYLIQSSSLEECVKSIGTIMHGSMIDYIAAKVEETAIMDVFEHYEQE